MYKLFFSFLLLSQVCLAQQAYTDSLQKFQQAYVQNHEVVTANADKKKMRFFPINKSYCVKASFEKVENSPWFGMATSGAIKRLYRVYGKASFTLNGKKQVLPIYQSQDLLQSAAYKNYLFLPFTDETTGKESYTGGRYIDIQTSDIVNNTILLDFNKAYNPYCAYVSNKYSCPIPPPQNHLTVAVKAGEKSFEGAH